MPDDTTAIDAAGRRLPLTSSEVRAHIDKLLDEPGSSIVAVIVQGANGDIAMPVFGPPSEDLLDTLKTVTRAYRKALRAATQ